MEYNYCVFIGRFQPFHKAHLELAVQALKEAKNLIIVVGSATSPRTIKNPWTYQERVNMISSALPVEDLHRVKFVSARDHYYNDSHWVTEIQQKVYTLTNGDSSIALIGSYKDSSSYYIQLFPQWDYISPRCYLNMDATTIRNAYFNRDSLNWLTEFTDIGEKLCHPNVYKTLVNSLTGIHFCDLAKEFEHIQEYKKQWEAAPYPVTFVTADAVVIQSGHVLVVKRKFNPGKGLYALPGGFLKQSETLEACALRELKEETGIRVPTAILQSSVTESKTFDFPNRSLRGRTITTAFCVKLQNRELPEVKGNDDAEVAVWLPLMDVLAMEDKFFEDHGHIIRYFINRN